MESHQCDVKSGYRDLISEDFGRRPVYEGFVLIHSVDHQGTTATNIVNGIVSKLLDTGRFNDDIETIRIVLLSYQDHQRSEEEGRTFFSCSH